MSPFGSNRIPPPDVAVGSDSLIDTASKVRGCRACAKSVAHAPPNSSIARIARIITPGFVADGSTIEGW
jgi:hypothetical protein